MVVASTALGSEKKSRESIADDADIISHEIRKKIRLINTWIDFLKKFKLWDRWVETKYILTLFIFT